MANIKLTVTASLLLANLVAGLQVNVNEKSPFASLSKLSKDMRFMLAREWDLSKMGNALLQNIVSNGIPSMNIPPLDPLELNGNLSLELPALPGVIDMDYSEFSNIKVTNLKSANFAKLTILPSLRVIIDLKLPLEVAGEWYNFTGTIGDLIPFYGFGDFNLSIDAGINVEVTIVRTSQNILQMSDLEMDLILDRLMVHFSNLMGGEGEIFNELIGELAGEILDLLRPAFFPDLTKSILALINDFLLTNEMTVEKLVRCVLLPDKCLSNNKNLPFLFQLPLKIALPSRT